MPENFDFVLFIFHIKDWENETLPFLKTAEGFAVSFAGFAGYYVSGKAPREAPRRRTLEIAFHAPMFHLCPHRLEA
jgi:hypothetical protein